MTCEVYTVHVYRYYTLWFNQKSQLHRTDGPAIEWANGDKSWYLNDKPLTEEQFKRQTSKESSCDGKIVEIDGQKYKLYKV